MAGINGKIPTLPPEGVFMGGPNSIYVNRMRIGYGASDRSAGGASDGCHRWLDTAGVAELFVIPAITSDFTSDGMGYKGLIVYDVWSVVKVAWGGATAITLGDCAAAAGFANSTEVTPGTTGVAMVVASSVFSKPAYRNQARKRLYISTDADQIEATFTGDATAGIMDVYVAWSLADFDQLANTDWPNS